MGSVGLEVFIILILTLANGFLAASEMALVSAHRSRLQQHANKGRRAARQALDLVEHPDRFLATVEIGITLIDTFTAAFGGASLSIPLAAWLGTFPALKPYAPTLALILVVAPLTYLSLVLGELVPKRLALQHAEGLAMFVAPIVNTGARMARPLVALLSVSVNFILSLLGQGKARAATITAEDIVYLAQEGTTSGTVERGEAQLIRRVFQFTDRRVQSIMTPRSEIVAVEVDASLADVVQLLRTSQYSRLPVYEETLDNIVGILHAKDVLLALSESQPPPIRQLVHPALYAPENQHIDDLLATFRRGGHLALVIDEYGQVSGLVTLEDVLEELVGEIADEYDLPQERDFVQREDGSWLVDGKVSYEAARQVIGLPPIPQDEHGLYSTLAGLIFARLGKIPKVGQQIEVDGFILEVVDMDERRIDRILVRPRQPKEPAPAQAQ